MTDALTLQNLRKVYPNGFEAVKGIDLSVAQGDFYALLGQNGAGKSTTIGMIAGLVNITSGHVLINGYDVTSQRMQASREIGVMPQEINLSVFETVNSIMRAQASYYGLSVKQAKPTIELLLKEARLWERRDRPARELSGGMKRRLMIARSMVHQPNILILDEPTAGVDIEIRQSVWRFINRMNREHGVTVILTTHYLEEAENLCNRIAILRDGHIVANDKKQALLREVSEQCLSFTLAKPVPERPDIDGVRVTWSADDQLDVCLSREQTLGDVVCRLGSAGINVATVTTKTNRLEQYFLELVGSGEQHDAA